MVAFRPFTLLLWPLKFSEKHMYKHTWCSSFKRCVEYWHTSVYMYLQTSLVIFRLVFVTNDRRPSFLTYLLIVGVVACWQ